MLSRTSMSSKLFLVVALLTFCTQITQSSGSVLPSASEEELRLEALENQMAAVEEKMTEMQKTLYELISTLLDDKSDGEDGRDHMVEKRDLSNSNLTADFEHSDEFLRLSIHGLSGLRGPPGKDGRDGRDGVAGPSGADGPPGATGAAGSPGATGAAGSPGRDGLPGAPGEAGPSTGGDVYTRWGRTTCGNGSTLLYEGFVGGSQWNKPGGGVNYQCMPLSPEHSDRHSSSDNYYSYLAGAEYQTYSSEIFPSGTHNQNVPCARCYTNDRAAVMMLPGKRTCPTQWTKEYEGFLMSEKFDHNHQTTFECVDAHPERIAGEEADTNGMLFYFVRPRCGEDDGSTHHCPPYNAEREITCIVCSK